MKGELTEQKNTVQNLYVSNLLLGLDASESHINLVSHNPWGEELCEGRPS